MKTLVAILNDFKIFFNPKTSFGKKRLLGLGAVLLIALIAIKILGGQAEEQTVEAKRAEVEVRSVSELSAGASFDTVGKVEAVSEANLQAESGGRITAVNVKVGDTVGAGGVIATLENSAQRAALVQAQGSYEAALAASAQSAVGVNEAGTAVSSAKNNLISTLRGGYNSSNSAITGNIDQFFSNPNSYVPGLKINSSGRATEFNDLRVEFQKILPEWSARTSSLSPTSDLSVEASYAKTNLNKTIQFCDMFIATFARHDGSAAYTDEQLKAYVQSFSALKSSLLQSVAAIETAESQLQNAKDSEIRAGVSAGSGTVSASGAQIKIALGSLQAAQSAYQKTIVRSPIQGVVNALYLKTGDYVSPGQPAAIIANNNGLQIKTFISEIDGANLNVGDAVSIEGGASGVITAKADALDPTNGKVAIVVGVNPDSGLTNGATVKVTFSQVSEVKVDERIIVPLSALKITPEGASVFTVNAEDKLEAIVVTKGQLYGDNIEILSGITKETRIVTDARGLKAGQLVTIK